MSETTTPRPESAAAPAAIWEDFVDIFANPVSVFARRRDGRAGLAMLIYTLIGALTFYVARPALQPFFDKQVSAQIAKIEADPQISADQKESMSTRIRGIVDSPLAYLGPVLSLPLSLLLTALVLWGVAKAFASRASFGQALAVTAIGGIPRSVLGLLVAAVSAATGRTVETPYALTLGPAALLGPNASDVLAAALSRLDVGVLWHTVLLGIGIAVVGRIDRSKGLSTAVIVWLIGGLAVLLSALRAVAAST